MEGNFKKQLHEALHQEQLASDARIREFTDHELQKLDALKERGAKDAKLLKTYVYNIFSIIFYTRPY